MISGEYPLLFNHRLDRWTGTLFPAIAAFDTLVMIHPDPQRSDLLQHPGERANRADQVTEWTIEH